MGIDGDWMVVISTPMGERTGKTRLRVEGEVLTGTMTNEFGETAIEDGEVEGDHLFWRTHLTQPMPITLEFELDVDGDTMTGTAQFGPMGEAPVRATRT